MNTYAKRNIKKAQVNFETALALQNLGVGVRLVKERIELLKQKINN